jgi:hypothetical protein
MSEPILPLARNLDTDRLFRVNNEKARLLRTMAVSYNDLNLDCFLPPEIPIWTEGAAYKTGDIVYGRYDYYNGLPEPETYVDNIWECKIDHIATAETQPVDSTTVRWRLIGTTPSARGSSWWSFLPFKYPPCGTLVGLRKYGGINRTPTGVIATIEGVVPPKPQYSDIFNKWLFDINGTYVLPLGLNPWIVSGLTSPGVQCYFEFRGFWNGQCHDLKKDLRIEMHTSSVDDGWRSWGSVFCGETEVTKCPTNYTIANLLPDTPEHKWTYPLEEDPNYIAWQEALKPAEALCGEVRGHWGGLGSITMQGFTTYRWIVFDMLEVDLSSDRKSARCTWRFALTDAKGNRAILKSNVVCTFYRQEIYDGIVGGSLEVVSPGTDGYFEKTISGVPLLTEFGVTTIRALGNRYHGEGRYFGSVLA